MTTNFSDPLAPQAPSEPPEVSEDTGPVVQTTARGVHPAVLVGIFAILAIALFLWLNGRRTQTLEAARAPTIVGQGARFDQAPPDIDLPLTPVSANQPEPFSGLAPRIESAVPPPLLPVPEVATGSTVGTSSAIDTTGERRSPTLIVDLGAPERTVLAQLATGAAQAAEGASGTAAEAAGEDGARSRLNEAERFAQRVGQEDPERARATPMREPGSLVVQGTMIPGVLETAINSDLPGYTRAVVSQDVRSFDGRRVLIPRGSRLIGQYKSAVALGQSRAFIIWTRAIRPDGVSIQIGSPGTDSLGRGGLAGEVNRHFFRRFSGSILLSVLNAGIAAIGERPSTQISIGSSGAAASLAGAAQGENISPTIKVEQGAAIQIFVARDLDFSGVEPSR